MQELEPERDAPVEAACEQKATEVWPEEKTIGRRSFLGALLSLGSAAVGALLAVPLLRYVLYPVYSKENGVQWKRSVEFGFSVERRTASVRRATRS